MIWKAQTIHSAIYTIVHRGILCTSDPTHIKAELLCNEKPIGVQSCRVGVITFIWSRAKRAHADDGEYLLGIDDTSRPSSLILTRHQHAMRLLDDCGIGLCEVREHREGQGLLYTISGAQLQAEEVLDFCERVSS